MKKSSLLQTKAHLMDEQQNYRKILILAPYVAIVVGAVGAWTYFQDGITVIAQDRLSIHYNTQSIVDMEGRLRETEIAISVLTKGQQGIVDNQERILDKLDQLQRTIR